MGLPFKDIIKDLQAVEQGLLNCFKNSDPVLQESLSHLLKAGGKRLRPTFALLAARCNPKISDIEEILPLAISLELVHMASLVHDDIIDLSEMRRGLPSLWTKWGDKVSVHIGDYLFAKALMLISQYSDPRIYKILATASVRMCEGEMQQMASICQLFPSVKNYLIRVRRKTALLISASCQLGAITANAHEDWIISLKKFGHYLGMAFQITDDLLDLTADPVKLGKPIGNDLRQGIVTLPVIMAIKNPDHYQFFSRLLMEEKKSDIIIEEAVTRIKLSGSMQVCHDIVNKYVWKAKETIADLPETQAKQSLIWISEMIPNRTT
jgi:heptaprenyl diphosphate synthase